MLSPSQSKKLNLLEFYHFDNPHIENTVFGITTSAIQALSIGVVEATAAGGHRLHLTAPRLAPPHSTSATTRAGAAEAPTNFNGKTHTLNPFAGRAARFTSCSMCQ